MYNGSAIPKVELRIILGSKAKIIAPINEKYSEKNFLQIKLIGITVIADINTLTILC